MAFADEFDEVTPIEARFFFGKVLRNDDPQKRGRIKALVPGICDPESEWAEAVGMPGAGIAGGLGGYFVPRINATVLIGFTQGDIDHPFYMPGPFPQDGAPDKVQEKSNSEAPNVRVIAQTETFEAYICDTEDEHRFVLRRRGDNETEILSINADDGSIRLNASRYLILNAPLISIDAPKLQLNERVVNLLGPTI